jgi:hypothetical protein
VLGGPAGLRITYSGLTEHRGADVAPVAEFVITVVVGGVSLPMIANGLTDWIDDQFGDQPCALVRINHREINFDDEGRVRQIIEQEIERERRR